jgi:hypothetical protein
MDMKSLNVSATLNIFRLITHPSLCLPHATISTFNHLPLPLNNAFPKHKNVDIRAVVLDKDNCFSFPEANEVYKPYEVRLSSFVLLSIRRLAYPDQDPNPKLQSVLPKSMNHNVTLIFEFI